VFLFSLQYKCAWIDILLLITKLFNWLDVDPIAVELESVILRACIYTSEFKLRNNIPHITQELNGKKLITHFYFVAFVQLTC